MEVEEKEYRLKSIDELDQLAGEIFQLIPDFRLLIFRGDLGSGKTTLIKNICKLLNVNQEVTSPSFSLVNQYLTEKGEKVNHFDLYRLNDVEEAYDIGCEEYFNSEEICLIEWPEIVEEMLPERRVEVNISFEGKQRVFNVRQIC